MLCLQAFKTSTILTLIVENDVEGSLLGLKAWVGLALAEWSGLQELIPFKPVRGERKILAKG